MYCKQIRTGREYCRVNGPGVPCGIYVGVSSNGEDSGFMYRLASDMRNMGVRIPLLLPFYGDMV